LKELFRLSNTNFINPRSPLLTITMIGGAYDKETFRYNISDMMDVYKGLLSFHFNLLVFGFKISYHSEAITLKDTHTTL
jgi:hypothetical protein